MKNLLLTTILFLFGFLIASSQEYTQGYYINLQHDTISCHILTYSKKKLSKQDYTEIVVKIDSTNEKRIKPQDIIEYYKNGNTFKSFYLSKDSLYCFGKLIVTGDVNVWEKISTSENSSHVYILRKKNDNNFVIMSISGNKIYVTEGIITTYKISQNELYWTAVLYLYFSDCDSITSKIKLGYYTSTDFMSIVKEYNNCNKIKSDNTKP